MKDRIRKVREENQMSLTKFAEALKTSVAAVSRYESGDRVPSDAVLNLICEKFHVSYGWLKNGEGPMMDPLQQDDSFGKLMKTYSNLPDRLKSLVDALAEMTPDWYQTLDEAFAEIERRKNKGAD